MMEREKGRITNKTKWLVALPFAFLVGFGLPCLASGDPLWFRGNILDAIYVALAVLMWIVATAFVDLNRPRGLPDRANLLLPLGLVLSVPISVLDRIHVFGAYLPGWLSLLGVSLAVIGTFLGLAARYHLGGSYSPRGTSSNGKHLIQSGPYRVIRHPIYTAAVLWMIGWPLIIRSFIGAGIGLCFLIPSLRQRIRDEESNLLKVFGEEYGRYQEKTWRLFPYLF
jgi:protein-S-isoprenylcysteine O-methyltransferase Ste14